MTHTEATSQASHRNARLQKTRSVRRFSSARYLGELMAELDRAAISARLKQSRTEAGLSQAEMAEILKVHENSVQNWERVTVATVPFDRLEEWAQITNTTKAWLLHGDDAIRQGADAEVLAQLATLEAGQERTEALLAELLRRLPDARDEPGAATSD